MSDLGTELAPGDYYVIVPEMRPCEKCGGPHVATFSARSSGYSCGSGHKHTPECPTLRCSHGILFSEPCPACDAVEELSCVEDCDG